MGVESLFEVNENVLRELKGKGSWRAVMAHCGGGIGLACWLRLWLRRRQGREW